jgi:L-iditol 2-dehydrogenase
VKITSAPTCTEYKAYRDGGASERLGHEAVGIVEEAPPGGRVRAGQRVVVMPQYPCGACDMCGTGDYIHCENCVDPLAVCGSATGTATYAQYCIKQDWLLIPIPDDISDDHASMACCGFGPSFGAFDRMCLQSTDTVLVVGLGPVGLGAVVNARHRGARVIGVEGNAWRASLAKSLGAREVLDPADPDIISRIRSINGGAAVDKAVDCTAEPQAQKLAVEATKRRGSVGFIGWGGGIATGNMIPGGRTLEGCWHWNLNGAPRMMRTIRECGPGIDVVITHRFPIDRVREAWEVQLTGQCGKVILHPWE